MSWQSRYQVTAVFATRLPLVLLAGFHLLYLDRYRVSQDPQFAVTNALLLQQAQLTWSSVSATIPSMKRFLDTFSLKMGIEIPKDIGMDFPDGTKNTYHLQNLTIGSRPSRFRKIGGDMNSHIMTILETDRDERQQEHSRTLILPATTQNPPLTDDGNSTRTAGSQDMIIKKGLKAKSYPM